MTARFDCCWACGEYVGLECRDCYYCGAPPWAGNVRYVPENGPGVYLVAAECGMWKIGHSGKSVARRSRQLIRESAKVDVRLAFVAFLPDAGRNIEQWLHRTFSLTRDRHWAECEHLPHPTEWFWPDLALRALVAGDVLGNWFEPELWEPAIWEATR